MHNKNFQDELGKFKGDAVQIKNSSHKAFVERLKKQVLSDDSSSGTGYTDSSDDDVCSEDLMREIEAKFDKLFVDLDDDD